MMKLFLTISVCSIATVAGFSQTDKPLLVQSPTLSKSQIAFAYGGEVWIMSREGGEARRLVTGTGQLSRPIFRRTEAGSPTRATTTATWMSSSCRRPGASRDG